MYGATNMTDKQPETISFRSMQDRFNGSSTFPIPVDDPLAIKLASWLDADARSLEIKKQAAAELRRLHESEREGWRYANELEQDRKRLHEENEALKQVVDDFRKALAEKMK